MSSLKNCLIVKKKDIYKLKKKLKFKKSARIILHHKFPKQQEMIIAQKKHYYFPVKKNTQSDQSFTILIGKLLILIFDKKGRIKQKILLSKKNNLMCRVKKGTYHCDISLSKFAVHLESKSGVFTKKTNSFGDFPKVDSDIKKILKKNLN